MPSFIQTCRSTGKTFEITERDQAFYECFGVPHPTLCPDERRKRRLAWRNERHLYKRTCDLTGKPIISSASTDKAYPVYETDAWWSDHWDPKSYGRDFDFTRPFFEQFGELLNVVPRLNVGNGHNENCDYVNYSNYSKDCYLSYGLHHSERVHHCWRVHDSFDCIDCLQCNRCELSYECIDCDDGYRLLYSQDCQNCTESAYLYGCRSCEHCFLCVGLYRKQYHILNVPYSKVDYEAALKIYASMSTEELRQKLYTFRAELDYKHPTLINCEDCQGSHLIDCQNCKDCSSIKTGQDCRHVHFSERVKDSMDSDMSGWPAELVYDSISTGVGAYDCAFCSVCWSSNGLRYCDACFHSSDLFGCIGLRQSKYCILNKQYTQEDYQKLRAQIIEHMKQTGEWGEFFPLEIAPFNYEESMAVEFFPTNHTSTTENKAFNITAQEKAFYEKLGLPDPTVHPNERHRRRMELRTAI